jgi:hypothetical protein
VAFADQGNSVYDFFYFGRSQYDALEPCYYQTVLTLNDLYSQFQPCQMYAFPHAAGAWTSRRPCRSTGATTRCSS